MKCNECKVETSDIKIFSDKKLCNNCYDIAKVEDVERKKLYQTICKLYKIDKPTGFMFAQIKRMKENNGWYYKNMRLTLHYVHDILKFELDPKYGVSSIEYHYNDMLEYYKRLQKQQERNKSANYRSKAVVTKHPELVNRNYQRHKMKDLSKYGRKLNDK